MPSANRYFNRVGAVAVWQGELQRDGTVKLKMVDYWQGLNFKFSFQIFSNREQGFAGRGEVSVLGLNTETIHRYASVQAPDVNWSKRYFITVYAGYDDGSGQAPELFTMAYTGAEVTSPPEMWLRFVGCEANAAFSRSRFMGDKTFAPMSAKGNAGWTVREACRYVTAAAGLSMRWFVPDSVANRLPRMRRPRVGKNMTERDAKNLINSWGLVEAYGYSFTSESALNQTAAEYGGINSENWMSKIGALATYTVSNPSTALANSAAFLRNRMGMAPIEYRRGLAIYPTPDLDPKAFKEVEENKPVVEISEDTGMIGPPHFGLDSGFNSVEVTTLLRHDLGVGALIHPVSKFIKNVPSYKYRIIEVSFEGELRGQPWYTKYKAVGIGG